MDWSGEVLLTLLLFVGLLFNWVKAAICAVVAVLVRPRAASAALAMALGAVEGLLGSRLELLDIYLTADGWATIDGFALFTVALSAVASLLWWGLARAIDALVRRLRRPAGAQ